MASKQKNILQYFKATTTVKRVSSNSTEVNGSKKQVEGKETGAVKKPKLMELKSNNPNGMITGFLELNQTEIKEEISKFATQYPALHTNICPSWFRALRPEFKKPYFKKLSNFLVSERQKKEVYPPQEHVWSWTLVPLEEVKVVILGQDPYHGKGQAHGLCFSVRTGIPPPPSLVNMYKELKCDIPGFAHPGHGNLTGWCKQGVLLLNATLTVRANEAKSHADQGWETFTDAVIRLVSAHCKGVVFLLWGSHAQSKAVLIDKKKHHILKSSHPSPLSVYRGFEGCKHFSQCNGKLKEQGKTEIDWNHLPA